MFEIEFIEGKINPNSETVKFARRAKRLFDLKKSVKNLSQRELYALSLATIHETSDAEVKRRMELRAARLIEI